MSAGKDRPDRLERLKERLKEAKVYYSLPNPRSDYQMDIADADDDFRWMIYEIERLRAALPREGRRRSPGDSAE